MKSVTISIVGVFPLKVFLFLNHKLIYHFDHCFYPISVCLKENEVYELLLVSNQIVVKYYFYVDNRNHYIFPFFVEKPDSTSVTFLLSDSYYQNLVIEKGEIIVCQK